MNAERVGNFVMAIMHTGKRPFSIPHGVATLLVAAAEEPTGAKKIYLLFLYFARDAHFRRWTTKESEINEYSGAP